MPDMWSAVLGGFDLGILHSLNGLVGRSPNFDNAIVFLTQSDLRGALLVAIFWWCWFRKMDTATTTRTREHVLRTLCGGIVAIFAARALALSLPFRLRPKFEPALHFIAPSGSPVVLLDWSSFPSDHAALFSALAVGLCFISWRAGLIGILYTVFIICLPRMYMGWHYPSDVVVGLSLGALVGYRMNVADFSRNLANRVLRWESASPGGFYLVFFMVSFEFSTMFESLRDVAVAAVHFGARLVAAL